MKILSFKKIAKEIHQLAAARNVTIDEVEVIHITAHYEEEEVAEALNEADVLLFTSFQAVMAILHLIKAAKPKGKRVYCVGDRTGNYFREAGLEVFQEKDAADLLALIGQHQLTEITYFHGDRTLDITGHLLDTVKADVTTISVYTNRLLYPRIETLNEYHILWLFSPSGVESFLKHNQFPEDALIATIGNTTASFIDRKNVLIASEPDIKTLLNESTQHYLHQHARTKE